MQQVSNKKEKFQNEKDKYFRSSHSQVIVIFGKYFEKSHRGTCNRAVFSNVAKYKLSKCTKKRESIFL